SQVEADAGQIAVNERFALFFQEKRPFFLEGTEIFGLPKQLVFTRTVVNPVAGAKVTGKMGSATVGYLGAVDNIDESSDLFVNLLRVRQDVGTASTIGAIYTDRTGENDDFNRVIGVDGRIVVARRYTLQVQGAASWDRSSRTETSTGQLFYAQVARAGRGLTFSGLFEDLSAGFLPESGFIRRLAEAHAQTQVSYNWYGGRGSLLERWGPSLDLQGYWDHDELWDGNGWQEATGQLMLNFAFKNNMNLWLTTSLSEFSSPAQDYEGLVTRPHEVCDEGQGCWFPSEAFVPAENSFGGLRTFTAFVYMSGWEAVRGRISANFKEEPIFYRPTGAPVEVADSWSGDVNLTLLPSRFLSMELGLRHSVLTRESDGSLYSKAMIPRIKAQYQFNRALFVRSTVEYSFAESNGLLDPLTGLPIEFCNAGVCTVLGPTATNDVLLEGLISYEPSPGTVFFFGYTRRMEDSEAFAFERVQPTADGLFLKASYRFRL
ncbi:MAG: hypothetical protein VYD78_05085, partial [Gemmatimonadota bacterium]|nr:hypothetical protein [Gemmatimonadota bacterium]